MPPCPRPSSIGRSISNFYRNHEVSTHHRRDCRPNAYGGVSRFLRDDGDNVTARDFRRIKVLQAQRCRTPANR